MSGAFEGTNVVEFCFALAGPMIAKYLADQGATVVRVESEMSPDGARSSAPYWHGKSGINRGGAFASYNANRYSLALNLKHPRSREIITRLIKWADVVVENFSPGTMEDLGLSYEELKKIRPDIIMVRESIQGQTGPHREHPGYGILASALCGVTNLTGWPDRDPSSPFAGYPDLIVPRFGAAALLACLDYRQRTGKGQCLDLSQYETTIHFIAPVMLDYLANGREATRMGNLSSYAAPHGAYRCKGDDRWCAVAVSTHDEWEAFCNVVGAPEWTGDTRFSTILARKQNEDELNRLVEMWTVNFTAEEVMWLMQTSGVPAGVVQTSQDLLEDPQLKLRQHFWLLNHHEIGPFYHWGQPFILSRSPARAVLPSPCLGEHTEFVCTGLLGIDDEEFVQLLGEGVFR